MASHGSYIRSAARATFSAYRSLPIRWRLAGGSAALTFVILAAFAVLVGIFNSRQVNTQFDNKISSAADQLRGYLDRGHKQGPFTASLACNQTTVNLSDYARADQAQIRIFAFGILACTQKTIRIEGAKPTRQVQVLEGAPRRSNGLYTQSGYRVAARTLNRGTLNGNVVMLYALPLSSIDDTLAQVQVFLILGVIGGTVLALLAGLATAQRAIRPIVELTDAAREIEQRRDPRLHVPLPRADDEVAELARTLEGMLQGLDAARSSTEAMLQRQREFVTDASHELRTPLTSVLASLELLAEELDGEQADTARAALRSARRMRRLVGDLLLLARADARRVQPRRPTGLSEVLTEAAAEIGPVADGHELSVDAQPASVLGARDELHRLVLNLIENAVRHTPPGTHIRAWTALENGDAVLVVEDDGPGIPRELEPRVFDRFVRGGRDGGRGSGLGLAIVRAVAEAHGGSVALERPGGRGGGARFVVRLPADHSAADPNGSPPSGAERQTSTTTGRTIGRRRSRS